METNLHKTERAIVTASSRNEDELCLVFSGEDGDEHKVHMPVAAMLGLGGMMAEVAHRRQLTLATRATRDN